MNKQACELKEKYYMNPNTGTVGTARSWEPYHPGNSELVEVVRDILGNWIEVEEKEFSE